MPKWQPFCQEVELDPRATVGTFIFLILSSPEALVAWSKIKEHHQGQGARDSGSRDWNRSSPKQPEAAETDVRYPREYLGRVSLACKPLKPLSGALELARVNKMDSTVPWIIASISFPIMLPKQFINVVQLIKASRWLAEGDIKTRRERGLTRREQGLTRREQGLTQREQGLTKGTGAHAAQGEIPTLLGCSVQSGGKPGSLRSAACL
ncbi:hypothetical protein B0T26DRAFT_756942 [Lasiosphaeria miniovina]|uniref:Uncharacterized protein n=1 Tax=Lasiosphaeria miniovina TaxID=1954250 RepID=A0AA39ZTF8_9PEZI|nr:uncharacterized protein B0T26DRAFT_756942 [Lasiosphaeria miniovina]KAK0703379.1 hypothetical protein B0T26DRAFT_756942 [Lasiosphaeria miniovina]